KGIWEDSYGKAEARYNETHRDGKAKGWQIRAFGRTLYTSKARKEAERAAAEKSRVDYIYAMAARDYEALQQTSGHRSQLANELYQKAEQLNMRVAIEGTEEDIRQAVAAHQESIRLHLRGDEEQKIPEIDAAELQVMLDEGELSIDQYEQVA